ncbi:MAG: hypothetical protein KDE31_27610, partial [Caldilineaceae bacterium]|nr:hypothetical protein [Caldilineaceae bacterium]
MFNPYFLVTFLYIALAVLGALDAALINFDLLPFFAGLRWMRVHFITLGALTELSFGILPLLVATRNGLPRPKIRWDIWLTLNLGLLILLLGIPPINGVLITTGGTLIFTAAILLIIQLGKLRNPRTETQPSSGRKFYIAGLAYLLLGIIVGTGLWQGWSVWLQIKVPLEVHIHANNWGFMSLVFAGFFVDLYPIWAKRPLANRKAIAPIFWMMSAGALFLVLSPWFASQTFAAIGALLHTVATVWLLVIAIKPLRGDKPAWTAGMAHMLASYFWLFAPLSMARFVIFGIEGVMPAKALETTTPQALIYGWVLQVGFAVVPYLFQRYFFDEEQAPLGGTWLSFGLVNLGSIM